MRKAVKSKIPPVKAFEQSKFDVEKKGIKENSPADIKRDKAQMKKMAASKAKKR